MLDGNTSPQWGGGSGRDEDTRFFYIFAILWFALYAQIAHINVRNTYFSSKSTELGNGNNWQANLSV